MEESKANKYLTRLEEAIQEDALALTGIFKACTEALAQLDAADISPEAKYNAERRMKRFIQDVYAAIPNTYKQVVQDLVQHALFPTVAEPSPLLEEVPDETVAP